MFSDAHAVFVTQWFTVLARPLADKQLYYMLELDDYVSVVALSPNQRVLFVSQYRPVVDRHTLELPSGHVDKGESPEDAIRRELLEETGFVADRVELLGTLVPDVGRLTNRLWCFFAEATRRAGNSVQPEKGLTVVELSAREAIERTIDGTVDHALNLAALFLAFQKHRLILE